jgi:hypothetical protein
MSGEFEGAVKSTFVDSLKSVFLVDDEFPTYSDMFSGADQLDKFKEKERAQKLYSSFRDRHLPCDIENSFTAGDLQMVERLRKCDLIVLDFHLDGEGGGNAKAIEILRKLADSPHFNTVVVYTKAPLEDVWLDVAANLRPDLRLAPFLEAHQVEAAWWDSVEKSKLIMPTDEAQAAYLTRGMLGVNRDAKSEMIARIRETVGGAGGDPRVMAEILIRSVIDDQCRSKTLKAQDEKDDIGPRSLQGRYAVDKPHWLQCRGCFIAIVAKSEVEDEAAVLMTGLQAALLDWKPNFLQILVSEIQNRLELESVAADPRFFSEATRQVGLSHYLLEELAGNEDAESAVESVIDRIIETLRHRISDDQPMRVFATKVLADIRTKLGDKLSTGEALARAAALAHVDHQIDPNSVISFLNAFLSTETFAKSRITTGSVFRNADDFWMVATPACDLTSRAPGTAQAWMKSIHPVRAIIAVKLRKVNLADALKTATQGRHVFIFHEDQTLCLSVLDRTTSAPDPEMFFTIDAGKVVSTPGNAPVFRGVRVTRAKVAPRLSATAEYTVVGQLRPNYASRVLQLTGAYLSRIGIDYFNVGGNGDV